MSGCILLRVANELFTLVIISHGLVSDILKGRICDHIVDLVLVIFDCREVIKVDIVCILALVYLFTGLILFPSRTIIFERDPNKLIKSDFIISQI